MFSVPLSTEICGVHSVDGWEQMTDRQTDITQLPFLMLAGAGAACLEFCSYFMAKYWSYSAAPDLFLYGLTFP